MKLTGKERKLLRGFAHKFVPQVYVGKNDLSEGSIASINQSLNSKELIKIKFFNNDCKNNSIDIIENKLSCNVVGNIGKILILYRQHKDPDKRKYFLNKD